MADMAAATGRRATQTSAGEARALCQVERGVDAVSGCVLRECVPITD